MIECEKTRGLILKHFERYPGMQLRDMFKFIYQSSFGCEHFVSSVDAAVAYIAEEYKAVKENSDVEQLAGGYCRVPLSYMKGGLSAVTLGKLFCLSAVKEENGLSDLLENIKIVRSLIDEGLLPFDICEFDMASEEWMKQGYPAVRHSEAFREKYNPSYRVVADRFIPFLPLFSELDKRIKNGKVRMAIEGGSASGKSTLSELLEAVYGCTVFHMDDFFLLPGQRTEERFSEIGGNVDYERFREEVLVPLSKDEAVQYRRFDCSQMKLQMPETIIPGELVVTEGAYSMHPALADFYDFSVFLDISRELQKERILKRNSTQFAERFFNEWIPLENVYFSATSVKDRCELCIKIDI